MANPAVITSFALLENAIEDHMNRTDIDDEGASALFIDLAEARFNREIRTIDMLNENTSFTIDSRTVAVPSNFLEVRNFEIDRTPVVPLEPLTVEEMSRKRVSHRSTGIPLYYTVKADSSNARIFEFLPSPNASLTARLLYYEQIPALSASNTTNWLLDSHPDIYLFACLVEAHSYVMDDERAALWESRLQQTLRNLKLQDERARIGMTPIQRWPTMGGYARRW